MQKTFFPLNRSTGKGFTLVELLIVVGIIALLMALLLPVLTLARKAAKNTVCASRIGKLSQACMLYMADNGTFPNVNRINGDPAGGWAIPHDIATPLINALSPYMGNYPLVTAASQISDYSSVVQCPFAEEWDSGRGPFPWIAVYTGYGYYGRLEEGGWPMHVIQPARCANIRGRRGVLWADPVVWYGPGDMWFYSHTRHTISPAAFAGLGFWHTDTQGLWGYHRAYSDGSVEWADGSLLDLNLANKDKTAGCKLDSEAYYWWF